MKTLSEKDKEAYVGQDCTGPSTLPQSYFDAVCPPEMAAKIAEDRAMEKLAAE